MSPTLYSQPFLNLFCEVENLDTQGFQFPRTLFQCGDLMRDCNVGEVRIDDLYDLIVVVGKFLKLEIKVIQPGDELRLRRIAFDDYEFLAEEALAFNIQLIQNLAYCLKCGNTSRNQWQPKFILDHTHGIQH